MFPFFAEHEIRCIASSQTAHRYCGTHDRHPYELYLAVKDIEHTRTKNKHPQTNGICERFQKTVLNEFYRVMLRQDLYPGLEALKRDLNAFLTNTTSAATSGALVLPQDAHADVSGQPVQWRRRS